MRDRTSPTSGQAFRNGNQGAKLDDGGNKNKGKGKDEENGEGKDAEESRERSRGQEAELKEYCRGKLQTTIYMLRKEAGLVKSSQARSRAFLFPLHLASFPHHFTIRSSLPPSTLLVLSSFVCSALRRSPWSRNLGDISNTNPSSASSTYDMNDAKR